MTAISSFSVEHEHRQCQWNHRPRNPVYTMFQGTTVNSKKKKLSRQLAAFLNIGGKLNI